MTEDELPGEGEPLEPPAFSNGEMWRRWEKRNCARCWHDRAARNGHPEDGCELIALGFAHQPVDEWVRHWVKRPDGSDFPDVRCTRFTPDEWDDLPGPPRPTPTPANQLTMVDRDDFLWERSGRREREAVVA